MDHANNIGSGFTFMPPKKFGAQNSLKNAGGVGFMVFDTWVKWGFL